MKKNTNFKFLILLSLFGFSQTVFGNTFSQRTVFRGQNLDHAITPSSSARSPDGTATYVAVGSDELQVIKYGSSSTTEPSVEYPLNDDEDWAGFLLQPDSAAVKYPVLQVGTDNQPRLCYVFDGHQAGLPQSPVDEIRCAVRNLDGSWGTQVVQRTPGLSIPYGPAMTLDTNNDVHLLTHTVIEASGFTGRVVYFTNQSGSFSSHDTPITNPIDYDIAVTADGRIHVVYIQSGSGLSYIYSQDGGISWSVPFVVDAGASATDRGSLQLKQDSLGRLHIAYKNYDLGKSTVKHAVNALPSTLPNSWNVTTVKIVSATTTNLIGSISLDVSLNYIAVGYHSLLDNNVYFSAKQSVSALTPWSTPENVSQNFQNLADTTGITLSATGSYFTISVLNNDSSPDTLSFFTRNFGVGQRWTYKSAISASSFGIFTDMALNPTGFVHTVAADPDTGSILFSHPVSNQLTVDTIVSSGFIPSSVSLAIGSDDRSHVLYRLKTSVTNPAPSLNYTRIAPNPQPGTSGMEHLEIVSGNDKGLYSDITLDSVNTAHISYSDFTTSNFGLYYGYMPSGQSGFALQKVYFSPGFLNTIVPDHVSEQNGTINIFHYDGRQYLLTSSKNPEDRNPQWYHQTIYYDADGRTDPAHTPAYSKISAVIGPDRTRHVVFVASNGTTDQIMYASAAYNPASTTSLTGLFLNRPVFTAKNVTSPKLVFDALDQLHLVFCDGSVNTLRHYIQDDAGDWVISDTLPNSEGTQCVSDIDSIDFNRLPVTEARVSKLPIQIGTSADTYHIRWSLPRGAGLQGSDVRVVTSTLIEPSCINGLDENGDGLTDCQDPQCAGRDNCPLASSEVCTGGTDEDLDGAIDCADSDCDAELHCQDPTPSSEVCTGGIDEDLDGFFDCEDADCESDLACRVGPPLEDCEAAPDEDGDGLINCNDSDCAGTPTCVDLCPTDPAKTSPGICGCGTPDTNTDGDGAVDCADECDADSSKIEAGVCGCGQQETDINSDGIVDCGDLCPTDPAKNAPGVCGCNKPDTDSDSDGVANCEDACENDSAKSIPGICGCGKSDIDTDLDGSADCVDECDSDRVKTVPGICGCGASETDINSDGIVDCGDLCPTDPAKNAPGVCGCGTPDTNTDGDGAVDCVDECDTDNSKVVPGICGCGLSDADNDGDGSADCEDLCLDDPTKSSPGACGCGTPDTDNDGDGFFDCVDECDSDINKTAPGTCGCGVPETVADTDGDGDVDCVDSEECDAFDNNGNGLINEDLDCPVTPDPITPDPVTPDPDAPVTPSTPVTPAPVTPTQEEPATSPVDEGDPTDTPIGTSKSSGGGCSLQKNQANRAGNLLMLLTPFGLLLMRRRIAADC